VALHRWLYRGGRPNPLTKIINQGWACLHALGILPDNMVALEVTGRQSGKTIRFPLALAVIDGERYLVSMLGAQANWVKNVRAARGQAWLVHGRRQPVRLEEVAIERRAPVLKAYLQIAPGARPHIPVDKDAPLTEFEKIAAQFPVFKVEGIRK
jgi:hypothetical protein